MRSSAEDDFPDPPDMVFKILIIDMVIDGKINQITESSIPIAYQSPVNSYPECIPAALDPALCFSVVGKALFPSDIFFFA